MSRQLVYSRGVGQYRVSETHVGMFSRTYKPNGTRRGILFIHGAGAMADTNIFTGMIGNKMPAIAAAGYPLISCDFGSPVYAGQNWANDDHLAAISAGWDYLRNTFGAKPDKVGVYCSSMGGCGSLAWARQNLSSVFAIATTVPVLDIDYVYRNGSGNKTQLELRPGIERAYRITYPTAIPNIGIRSPVAFGAGDLAGLPVRIWASSDDAIASNTAACRAWNGKGATVTVVDLGGVAHEAFSAPPDDVVAFFDANGGRS